MGKRLRGDKEMAFKDDFRKALHDGRASLYDSFLDIARKSLPADADARYQYLRSPNGRFVARDENDVNVYTVRVAARHSGKFKWLYDALFSEYRTVFSKDLDVVVWGCGCGLDLLALYDRAAVQKNPQLWVKVRHITLVDISNAALERAKLIAEILFPLAEVVTVVCNLMEPDEIRKKVRPRHLTAYLPRVHLISNLLDLFEDVVPFANSVKNCSGRNIDGKLYFNELVVAFSPEYRGGRVARNVSAFRNAWGLNIYSQDVKTIGDAPMNCEFCAFAYQTLVNDRCYRSYMRGRNPLLNKLVSECSQVEYGFDFHRFVTALANIKVHGMNFFKIYRWCEVVRFRGPVQRLVFAANPSLPELFKPCTVELDREEESADELLKKAAGRALRDLTRRSRSESGFKEGRKDDFLAAIWNGTEISGLPLEGDGESWVNEGGIDYSLYFRIDPGDEEPLPPLESAMDAVQREVVYSRAQYRKIKGYAGCGKSTTMMWHAVLCVLRTHLPALLVCKTVTLFNRNARRMAATLLQEVPELEYVDSNLFEFKTLDRVLCDYTKLYRQKNCILDACVRCEGCEHGLVVDCRDFRPIGNNWRTLEEAEKLRCCDACVERNIHELSHKGTRVAECSKEYGCVMIDEVQSVKPSLVQAVVNLTYGGNESRECYVFCDERQCLEPSAVEIDEDARALRVKVPDRGVGYGRWVDLKTPYRVSGDFTGRLVDVAVKLQSLTVERYGAIELARIVGSGQMNLSVANTFCIRHVTASVVDEIANEIDRMRRLGRNTVTVICDMGIDIRMLLTQPVAEDWVSTHLPAKSHDEQKLRMQFKEMTNKVHLISVMLAQGWDFENVIFVTSAERDERRANVFENILTGATRAKTSMTILDCSNSGWLYETLKMYSS